MNKNIKRLITGALVVILLIVGFAIGVGASDYVVTWKGTPKVETTMLNLDKINDIEKIIKELKETNLEQVKDIEYLDGYTKELLETINQYEKLIVNRDNAINELHGTVNDRDNTINELTKIINDLDLQLEQAYKDISMIDTKLEGIVGE